MSICITGLGVCCPLGLNTGALWRAIAAGRDSFREVDRFALEGLPCRTASAFSKASLQALRDDASKQLPEASTLDAALLLAVLAGQEALVSSGLGPEATRIGLVLASSAGTADAHDRYDSGRPDGTRPQPDSTQQQLLENGAFSTMAATVCALLKLRGPRLTVNTACASGGHALAVAMDLIRGAHVDRVLVLGADSLHPSLFLGFHSVGVLSETPCGPFGPQEGMSLGEGAAAIVLEAAHSMRQRGASARGVMLGWGGSSDAYHPTSPEPRGDGVRRSIESVITPFRGTQPAFYYNAHGTGTLANDGAEAQAAAQALGPQTPVSSSKSQVGHTQGAAGVLEAVITLLALEQGAVPPSLRSLPHRRLAPEDTVADGLARAMPVDIALSQSSAFGGTNVTAAFGLVPPTSVPFTETRAVYVHGVGAAHGLDASIEDALDQMGARRARPTEDRLKAALRGLKVRRLDPVSAVLTGAAGLALRDAGLRARSPEKATLGMVVGMADGPQQSIRRFVDSRGVQGAGTASASAFARMVLNAPMGAMSYAHQLRGPSITLWSGIGAGLQSLFLAATQLSLHDGADRVLAGGADEAGHLTRDRARLQDLPGTPLEAAALLVLGVEPSAVELKGWRIGSPDEWLRVCDDACGSSQPDRVLVCLDRPRPDLVERASRRWSDAQVIELDRCVGFAPAAGGALATVAAARWIRARTATRVLVLSVGREAGAVAILFEASPGAPR